MKQILLIEDEEDIIELVSFHVKKEGVAIKSVGCGEEAISHLANNDAPDLILLDLMLPGMSGLDICRTLKTNPSWSRIPVIMVSAKNDEADIVQGLELGAEDYIAKPFSPKVLIARIKAVFRRVLETSPVDSQTKITVGNLVIDPIKRKVMHNSDCIDLTFSEFQALHLMAQKPGWVFTRMQIVESIHGEDYVATDRTVDVLIVGLRKKLKTASDMVETIRGVGYRFKEQ